MRLDARARAMRGDSADDAPPPIRLGTSDSRSPRSSRWRGAARRGAGLRVQPPRSPTRRVRFRRRTRRLRGSALAERARRAGCFCAGAPATAVRSPTRKKRKRRRSPRGSSSSSAAPAPLAASPPPLSAGEDLGLAARRRRTPHARDRLVRVLDASNPASPRFRPSGRRRNRLDAVAADRRSTSSHLTAARVPSSPPSEPTCARHDHEDRGRSSSNWPDCRRLPRSPRLLRVSAAASHLSPSTTVFVSLTAVAGGR